MKRNQVTFTWRIERSIRGWLKEEAKINGRSMNAQLSEIVSKAKEQVKEKTA